MRWQLAFAFAGPLVAVPIAFLTNMDPVPSVQLALLASLMAAVAVTDYLTYRVPDTLVLAMVASGLGFAFALAGLAGLFEAALRLALVGAVLVALREIYFRWRGFDGLGLGDIKLMAAAGAWMDIAGLANAVLFAALAALALAGLVAAWRGLDAMRRLPFATFLAPSIVAAWFAAHW